MSDGIFFAKLDPDWINIDTLRDWLRYCDEHHAEKCWSPFTEESQPLPHDSTRGRPQYLIDVNRGCLVSAESHHQYAALSYAWGDVPMLKTVKANLAEHMIEGAFSSLGDTVAKTIRHSMGLSQRLHIPYMWADCLCIVQDDKENLQAQIQDMAFVYAGAYVTLVAANGWDANHGLRGIRGVTDPRQLSPNFGSLDLIESLQPHSSYWYSRAWTFQEMVFSRRTIMLQYQVAIWGCRLAAWHEATGDLAIPFTSLDNLHISKWGGKLDFPQYPSPQHYIGLVREYNNRKLRYPGDAYHAITGLLSIWNQSFSGSFISGLPQMFFESALLWQPLDPLQRRIPTSATPQQHHLPSWSWLGWEGEIDSLDWSYQWDLIHPLITVASKVIPRVTSIHQWSTQDPSGQTVAIPDFLKKSLEQAKGLAHELPSGWQKLGSYFYHERFPNVEFPYPVALTSPGQRAPVTIPVNHLFCRTQHAFFRFSNTNSSVLKGGCDEVALRHPSKKEPIGWLRLHGSKSPDYSLEHELVAISAGVILSHQDNALASAFFSAQKGMVQVYNVMWIEWVDKVAYRKGLGVIRRKDWDAIRPEEIDLILG